MASEQPRLMQRVGLLESECEGKRIYDKGAEPHLAYIIHCIEERFGNAKVKPDTCLQKTCRSNT